MKAFEYRTTKGNVVKVEKDETPYKEFEYYIDGVLVAKGRKIDIQKELGISNTVLNRRLNNTRVGRIKKRHELVLIER